MMEGLRERYRRFREWQQQPYQVAPLSEEEHECTTCGTRYVGNFCPRCGQSAKIDRYSFRKTFLLFLDVWGMGNRGMFRSIRDLLFRPGYMIRDYLRGMLMAYFPPFKMFFLLLTLTLIVDTGLNIQGVNRVKEKELYWAKMKEKQAEPQVEKTARPFTADERRQLAKERAYRQVDVIIEWIDQHFSALLLVGLLLFSVPFWLFFRHSPAMPDLRLSECFVAMVYIANMLLIFNIVPSLLCFSPYAERVYYRLSLLLIIIPISQFSGYGYWSTIWRVVLTFVPFLLMVLLLCVALVMLLFMSTYFTI